MTEKLLQFIWQYGYFNKIDLVTGDGQHLHIIHQGVLNCNQGPDFINASIKIGNVIWAGNVELHIKSSDWILHKHNNSKHYNNIILHVVWKNDADIIDANGYAIPTLELENLVPKILFEKYEQLMENSNKVACEKFLPVLNSLGWTAWKERLVAERLELKSKFVLKIFNETKNNWEETLWQVIAYNFGLKQNADLFLQMAKSVSINILYKHKNQILQLEALLLGQSNLLNRDTDNEYEAMLYKEFDFLQKKYNFKKVEIQPVFLRMRPANFPTIRLAQLADLLYKNDHLFSTIKQIKKVENLKSILQVSASSFWDSYYVFDKRAEEEGQKHLGKQMIDTIIINTIVPVLFAYGLYHSEEEYKQRAIDFLQLLSPEKNSITRYWQEYDVENNSAFDSQALVHLYNLYCTKKMCLSCALCNKLLSK